MKNSLFLSVAACSVLGSVVFAGSMGPAVYYKDWKWVSSIAAGPVWARVGDNQTFFLNPEIEKTYLARKSTSVLASGELFVGIQKPLPFQWQWQLGLAVATTSNAKPQGIIWDDTYPQFDNHRYFYKVANTHIAIKGKLLLDKGHWVIPWVSASLGVGFNRAYDFTNTPLIFEALPNPNFTDHTKTAFTYTLGAGVQKPISEHWQMGVGYDLAAWGVSGLNRAAGQSLNTGLTLNNLYTNGVLFNLTYIA